MSEHSRAAATALADLDNQTELAGIVRVGFSGVISALLALNAITEDGHDKVAGQVESGMEEIAGAIKNAADRQQLNLDFPLRPVKAS